MAIPPLVFPYNLSRSPIWKVRQETTTLAKLIKEFNRSLTESIYKYVEENGRTYHAFNLGSEFLGKN